MTTENANSTSEASSLQPLGLRMWRVTVERTLMVMAADERSAEQEAVYYAREEDSEPEMVAAQCVSSAEQIPLEWRDSIPWGGDREDSRTCSERLDSQTVGTEREAERVKTQPEDRK